MATALVVDDSATDRKLIGGLLEKYVQCEVEYAANGNEALTKIQQGIPVDIVLTDMQMPEMDGLNLIQAIRIQYTDLPIVIITGRGSEELATQALEVGAASYVPKSKLAQMLPDTIDDVLAVARADRSYASLIKCMTRNAFSFELSHDPSLIDPLVDLVQQMVFGVGLCDGTDRFRVGIAMEQALLNAVYRGNLEISHEQMEQAREDLLQDPGTDFVEERRKTSPYSERKVNVDVEINDQQVKIVIRDEGAGFDTTTLPQSGDPQALERDGGRGLVLMKSFMDEVSFNEKGNEVSMVKRRRVE